MSLEGKGHLKDRFLVVFQPFVHVPWKNMYSALLQLKISLYIAIKTFIIYVQKRFPFILSKWCSWVDLFEIDSSSGSKVMVQGGPWARLCAHLYVPALCTKGSRAPGGLFLAIQI